MSGTLSEFTSQIKTRNVSRPTLFYVQFTSPPGDSDVTPDAGLLPVLPFFCFSASTPGHNFLTQDNYSTAGTKRKFIYDHDYGNLRLDFYCDQNYQIKKYFDAWITTIRTAGRVFNYPDAYTAENLDVFILDIADNEIYQYNYTKVVPKTISEVSLNWKSGNEISTFTVDFVFEEAFFIEKTGLEEGTLPSLNKIATTNPISQITNNEIVNKLLQSNQSDESVQTIIKAIGGGVAGAII